MPIHLPSENIELMLRHLKASQLPPPSTARWKAPRMQTKVTHWSLMHLAELSMVWPKRSACVPSRWRVRGLTCVQARRMDTSKSRRPRMIMRMSEFGTMTGLRLLLLDANRRRMRQIRAKRPPNEIVKPTEYNHTAIMHAMFPSAKVPVKVCSRASSPWPSSSIVRMKMVVEEIMTPIAMVERNGTCDAFTTRCFRWKSVQMKSAIAVRMLMAPKT
mmetsp:Transcript_836/g.2467  ORF Transcript_836/g.2467 Transcript_836/m.2467 type:complete len:216 (+) Transcript_836:1869-2516(+)